MVGFSQICKMYDEIQLNKNNFDLNNQKINNHPPSPGYVKKTQITDLNNHCKVMTTILPKTKGTDFKATRAMDAESHVTHNTLTPYYYYS